MKILLTGWGLLCSLALLAGCATTTPGLGDESGFASLAGLTLLDSSEQECDGTVQVAEEGFEDDYEGLEGGAFVEPGENTVFELDDDDMEWACVDDDDSEVDEIDCPAGATHVRITRADDGGEVLVECFGE